MARLREITKLSPLASANQIWKPRRSEATSYTHPQIPPPLAGSLRARADLKITKFDDKQMENIKTEQDSANVRS